MLENPLSETEMVDRIYAAVMDHRLPPGTKLSEKALCESFNTSRMRIRRVLLILDAREIVSLHSNRGAFVASPSAQDARNIFDARRLIEPSTIKIAVDTLSASDLAQLQQHAQKETLARQTNSRHESIRLSGSFHIKLAAMSGNPVMARIVEDLVMRTSLIIGLYGRASIVNCSEHEHQQLIDCIAQHDGEAAGVCMLEHLNHIESELDLSSSGEKEVDIRHVLGAVL